MPDLLTFAVGALRVVLVASMCGAFGGDFAKQLLAPLCVAMNVFALRYWSPGTWSKPDAARLPPSPLPLRDGVRGYR
jgi:hypothetical protein